MIKHSKSKAFYNTFERKGTGQKVTHYCPGCGHGTVHKLIAEAIDDFGIQDRSILISPVGCSVFAYWYFDVGNIQAPHGRAPAVATGIKRVLDDAVVISYQGDGDLCGIGTAEIIHAANRGENMVVFFINNAIYGMTGGQMAPTTLINQKTKTTPLGRDKTRDGYPLKMCEILGTMEAPVLVERVSLGTPKGVLKARMVIRKALQNQKEKKGFSFVEILSPCPINWQMSPVDARKWLVENLETFYPVKNFKDIEKKDPGVGRLPTLNDHELLQLLDIEETTHYNVKPKDLEEHKVKIAGFGGQGVMSVGILLANCGLAEGLNATWLPSYGPEMRGGTAYASIVLSGDIIGTPVVDNPNTLIVMNKPSLDAFEDTVLPGGLIIVNSSLVNRKVKRQDVKVCYVPATELATKIGLAATAAVIILTVFAKVSGIIGVETIKKVLPLSLKNKKYVDINLKAIDAGEQYE